MNTVLYLCVGLLFLYGILTIRQNKTSEKFNSKIPKPIRDISYDSAQNVILIFLSFDIGWSFNAMMIVAK